MQPIPFCPSDLEAHFLAAAQRETRASSDRDALLRLLPDIRRLADRFTTARPAPSSEPYLRTTRQALAYSLYFAPLSHARMAFLLPELPLPPPDAPVRVLDLGAGTGAAAFAALRLLAPGRASLSLDAVDLSRPALRCLRDAFTDLRPAAFPSALLRTHAASLLDFAPPPAAYDVVLLHYVLNELSPGLRATALERAARALAPGGFLLVCEPLLRAEGDWLRPLREHARTLGLHVHGPCPHDAPCPRPPDDPCHAVRSFPLPRSLQILNAQLRRDLRHLAFSWLLLSPTPPPADRTPFLRVTAPPRSSNGFTTCPACGPDAVLAPVQILHRNLPTPVRKHLRHLERGEALPVAGISTLGDPPIRRATLPP